MLGAAGLLALLGAVLAVSLTDSGARLVAVEVEEATEREIRSVVLAEGEVRPIQQVAISAKVVGEIVSLPVEEGEDVRVGQVLARLERDGFVASVEEARAGAEAAEISLQEYELRAADAARRLAQTQRLFQQGVVSKNELERARLDADRARLERDAQQQVVLRTRSAAIRLRADLERTVIRSPIDGVVVEIWKKRGETVVPGDTNLPGSAIMSLADVSKLVVEAEVSEVDIAQVSRGQTAVVRVGALANTRLKGSVVDVRRSGRRDGASRKVGFGIRVLLEDPPPSVRPSMTAEVRILTARKESVLTAPTQAVLVKDQSDVDLQSSAEDDPVASQEIVFVLVDGRARTRPVETGIADETRVEILSGLAAQELVIVGPYRSLKDLRDGDRVQREEASSAP